MTLRLRSAMGAALPIATALTLLAAGCGVLPEGPPEMPGFIPDLEASAPEDYISDDGFSRSQRVALRVRTESCTGFGTGSAWVLDATTAVTNKHVVADSSHVEVTSYDGRNYVVTDMVVATFADLALLTIDGEFPEFAVIADQEPEVGDTLHVVGFPEGSRLTVTSGRLGSTVPDPLGQTDDEVYQIHAPVKPGNSGSPIVNDAHEVVGVVYAGNEFSTSHGVSYESLQLFLSDGSTHLEHSVTCTRN